jgi:hypothetical protein
MSVRERHATIGSIRVAYRFAQRGCESRDLAAEIGVEIATMRFAKLPGQPGVSL